MQVAVLYGLWRELHFSAGLNTVPNTYLPRQCNLAPTLTFYLPREACGGPNR